MGDLLAIVARIGLYATLAPLFGIPAFVLAGLRSEDWSTAVRWMPIVVIMLGLVTLALSILQLIALAAAMGGTALLAVDSSTLAMLLASGGMATAWKIRVAVLVVGIVITAALRRHVDRLAVPLTVTGAIALGSLAWFGHGAADEGLGGWIHLGADLLHLLAVGLWAGALATFCWLLAPPSSSIDRTYLTLCARALGGFAGTGTLIVATLIVSGIANGAFLIGWSGLPDLATSSYGRLLLLKLAGFAGMLALAASNRFRLTPMLAAAIREEGDSARAVRRLRHSVLFETLLLVVIIALVGWLGTLQPPVAS